MVHPDPQADPQAPKDERTKGDGDGLKDVKKVSSDQSLWRLLGLGAQLAATVAVFVAIGWWVDKHFGVTWGSTTIGMFGIVAGLYNFVRESSK